MKKYFMCAGIILLFVLLSVGWFVYKSINKQKEQQVFIRQISQLENYRADASVIKSELCYEGMELNSGDFYKRYLPYEDREKDRMLSTVGGFINGLGFELSDFSVELYLRSKDDKFVECITYYNETWYCIKMDMESGLVDIVSYMSLETNKVGRYMEYKLVSDKEEKVLFKLI